MTDRISYTFLELPKVKDISDDSSNLEKLCYALHNMTTERDIRNQISVPEGHQGRDCRWST